MNSHLFRTCSVLLPTFFWAALLNAEDRRIDPTFLHRDPSAAKATTADFTTSTCHYKPLFGQGDHDRSVVIGIARYGEVILDPNGACTSRDYPEEDQVYVVLEGAGSVKYGNENVPLTWASTQEDLRKPHSQSIR
jgi:hypothetical protein